jgi:hypothetical protein
MERSYGWNGNSSAQSWPNLHFLSKDSGKSDGNGDEICPYGKVEAPMHGTIREQFSIFMIGKSLFILAYLR